MSALRIAPPSEGPPPAPDHGEAPAEPSGPPFDTAAVPAAPPGHIAVPGGSVGDFAAVVHGEAMGPKYRDGDIVVFSAEAEVVSGSDALVQLADGSTVFRRVLLSDGPGGEELLVLVARNRLYPARTVRRGDVRQAWRAVRLSRGV